MPDLGLRNTFNSDALLYDEMRPGYPDELIQDVVNLSGIPELARILEVGCGTGQATRSFAVRGYQMVCLDVGTDLIEVAKEKLSRYSNVSFVLRAFEDWSANREFHLVISATAFHWVDPDVSYIRAGDTLKSLGALATFSNLHVSNNQGFFVEVQEVYQKHYLVPDPAEVSSERASSPEPGVDAFDDPIRREYPWSQRYTAEEYIKLLGTYSGHIALPETNQMCLFEGISNLIDKRYGGSITKNYQAVLDFRKKKT